MFGKKDKAGITALADALKANTSITELNLARNKISAIDTKILAPAISDSEAISSVNLLKNDIGVEQARALVIILKEHLTLKSLCGNKGDETELDMSGKMKGNEDAIMLVAEIVDNGALLVLSLKSNNLQAAGGKALAEGLKGNQVITELNIAGNTLSNSGYDMSGVVALADVIPGMRALSVLSLKDNRLLTAEAGRILSDMVATNTVLKELDLSSNNWQDGYGRLQGDGPGFARELAVGIRDNGALSTFTFSGDFSSSKPVTMETTMIEADFSGKGLGAPGGMMVAAFLPKCQ
jgi:Ran GTPase-activating protein (RanGAP) involved in mRNA processing and transport